MAADNIHYIYNSNMGIELIYCGNSTISYPLHNHVSVLTVGIVLDGHVALTVNGERKIYGKNQSFVIYPYMPHSILAHSCYTLLSICIDKNKGEHLMIKAVIFDMYETLITHYQSPLYFGKQMAADAGIPESKFGEQWHSTEIDRTIGKMTLEEVIESILRDNGCYSEEVFCRIVQKRIAAKEECFRHLHKEIVPTLDGLRERGMKVGLISNCFSEEATVIRKSILFPYFDAVCLSYEQGMRKPDAEIFTRCVNLLGVGADECLYVGDGGSHELEEARAVGMNAVQAVWYLQEGVNQPCGRKEDFVQIENPLGLFEIMTQN